MSDPRDPPPPGPPRGDDGVRITPRTRHPRPGRVLAVLAIAVVAGVVGWRLLAIRAQAPGAADSAAARGEGAGTDSRSPVATAAGSSSGGTRGVAHAASSSPRGDGEDPTPDLSDYVLPGEAPSMAEVITALHRRGIRTGLGAFQPHGTSPPLTGLEVPEGFALPAGYVRHHQATDDGQPIAPILMFHPDVRYVDLDGRRVAVPPDRVVPPELAPPGMPRTPVRIPPPRDGSGGP
jgi:hypothetical protein